MAVKLGDIVSQAGDDDYKLMNGKDLYIGGVDSAHGTLAAADMFLVDVAAVGSQASTKSVLGSVMRTYFLPTNAEGIGKVLTGLDASGGGPVAATDTILAAFGRLENRVAINDVKVTDANHNTDIDVNNANLLTRLAALESAGGATDQDITIGVDAGDTIVITGNLTVSGTTTTVNTETINLADNTIVLNSNWADDTAPTQDSGLTVYRGTGTGSQTAQSLFWDESEDRWAIGHTEASNEFTQTENIVTVELSGGDTDPDEQVGSGVGSFFINDTDETIFIRTA